LDFFFFFSFFFNRLSPPFRRPPPGRGSPSFFSANRAPPLFLFFPFPLKVICRPFFFFLFFFFFLALIFSRIPFLPFGPPLSADNGKKALRPEPFPLYPRGTHQFGPFLFSRRGLPVSGRLPFPGGTQRRMREGTSPPVPIVFPENSPLFSFSVRTVLHLRVPPQPPCPPTPLMLDWCHPPDMLEEFPLLRSLSPLSPPLRRRRLGRVFFSFFSLFFFFSPSSSVVVVCLFLCGMLRSVVWPAHAARNFIWTAAGLYNVPPPSPRARYFFFPSFMLWTSFSPAGDQLSPVPYHRHLFPFSLFCGSLSPLSRVRCAPGKFFFPRPFFFFRPVTFLLSRNIAQSGRQNAFSFPSRRVLAGNFVVSFPLIFFCFPSRSIRKPLKNPRRTFSWT